MSESVSRRQFLRVIGAGGLGLLGLPARAAARTNPRPRAAPTTEGATPAFLGAFSEPQGVESGYVDSLQVFESEIGRQVSVYRSYRNWGRPILNSTITELLNRMPPPRLYVSIHAQLDTKGRNPISWAAIAAGQYNSVIDSYVDELLEITLITPVYLCFHHEMENEENKCGSPDDFQAAYWYFRNRIQILHSVPNLTWVVTYMGSTFLGKHGGPDRWWPDNSPYPNLGPDQLMGVDLYNRNLCHYKAWREFSWLAGTPWEFATWHGRPLFIGECGSVEGDACGATLPHGTAKAQWFQDALTYMRDTAPVLGYTPLEAFCYSNIVGFNEGSYRIDTSPESQQSFASCAGDAFFSR